MRTSANGINLIKEFESLHDGDLSQIGIQPKMDPIGIWTEGYGRAMRNKNGVFLKGTKDKQEAYSNITIHTKEEADVALVNDLGSFERIVSTKIKIPINKASSLLLENWNFPEAVVNRIKNIDTPELVINTEKYPYNMEQSAILNLSSFLAGKEFGIDIQLSPNTFKILGIKENTYTDIPKEFLELTKKILF